MSTQVRSLSFARTIRGQLLLTTGFACLTALGAAVQIPIGPVPITLQVLFVLLSGLVLGSRLGALSQMQYLAIGFAGAPVFAGGKSGLVALLGPTGGYLVGFVAAAYVAGLIAESAARPGRVRFFVAGLLGTAAIYICGAMWLSTWFAIGRGTSWIAELGLAWQFGVMPFILLDAGKALVASAVTLSGRSLASLLRR
jgi:biotin transport system substrate-specific component